MSEKSLLKKGKFEKINNSFIADGKEILKKLSEVQKKYGKGDTDTFINELRDSIVGDALGFKLVNIDKHGFDCKTEKYEKFLEVKSASFNSKTWVATFNDTTIEKAESFKSDNVYLALAVWRNASDLLFICYGKNKKIGEFLLDKVKKFKSPENKTVRSTYSITLSKLVFEYHFKILAVEANKNVIKEILIEKNRSFKNIKDENIINFYDFDRLK